MNYQRALKDSGAILFVGSFLGLVFLRATGSIIFFKMLTEAEEDKNKYAILYKIGVSEQAMKKNIIIPAILLLGVLLFLVFCDINILIK